MKLKEFEGKQLFESSGITVSSGILIRGISEVPSFQEDKVFKVQVVSNGRAKAGGVFVVSGEEEAREKVSEFLGKAFLSETVSEILLDEKIDIVQELYLGILFDTRKRVPVFLFSQEGGVDIESLQKDRPSAIVRREINVLIGLTDEDIDSLVSGSSLEESVLNELRVVMKKLWDCFVQFDMRMVEINPLAVERGTGRLVAVDSVVVLDDDANYRREKLGVTFSERTDNRQSTAREIAAHKIDKDDHRGVAGKTFIDLDGDIAILTSGGGASMTLMDALLAFGGKAANFTEYSGNPPREKVEKLTRIVLDKKGLSGLMVAGVIANFTNIKETLQGIVDVLIEMKESCDFPIVIRRAGPHDDEAKIMLEEVKQEHGLDIHYFDEKTPLTEAARIMVELSDKYKSSLPSQSRLHLGDSLAGGVQ